MLKPTPLRRFEMQQRLPGVTGDGGHRQTAKLSGRPTRCREAIRGHLEWGYTSVYDADLKGYFDTIPYAKLLLAVRHRITDGSVLHLQQSSQRAYRPPDGMSFYAHLQAPGPQRL